MTNIYTPLQRGLGDWIDNSVHSSFEDSDIVLIPGGSDVNPTLYGHTKLPTTHIDMHADKVEMSLINDAIKLGKFIVGICKGSQMLTARAGGWLIQHVTNHGGYHDITTHDGKTLTVNSSHHQMSYPYDLPDEDYELLAWAEEISSTYLIQGGKDFNKTGFLGTARITVDADAQEARFCEPEVIWYPGIRGLAVQSHPEWSSSPPQFNEWLNDLVRELITR